MELVYDESQLKAFYEEVYPKKWKDTEVAFLSLTARSKYMEEGKELVLGRGQEMVDRAIVRRNSYDLFLSRVYSFSAPLAYRDEVGTVIPQSVMAYYAGLHLCSAVSAWKMLSEKFVLLNSELASHAYSGGGNMEHVSWQLTHIDGMWWSALQNSWTHRIWLDFDLDILDRSDDERAFTRAFDVFSQLAIKDLIPIHTRGGWHFLVNSRTSGFNRDVNPPVIEKRLEAALDGICKEVMQNHSGLIPLPGTMQGGRPVSIIKP